MLITPAKKFVNCFLNYTKKSIGRFPDRSFNIILLIGIHYNNVYTIFLINCRQVMCLL